MDVASVEVTPGSGTVAVGTGGGACLRQLLRLGWMVRLSLVFKTLEASS